MEKCYSWLTLAEAEAAAAIDNDYTQKKSVILTMNSSWEVLAEVDMENNAVNVNHHLLSTRNISSIYVLETS
jgi:hypothetical protein